MWEKPSEIVTNTEDIMFMSDGYRKVLEAYTIFQNDPSPANETLLENARKELRKEMGYTL